MATTAAYIPVSGNFKAADGFRFQNSAGDPILPFNTPPFGPGRVGKFKCSLVLVINNGPVGADASFKPRMPYPIPIKQSVLDLNLNSLFPVGSLVSGLPGSAAQELIITNAVFDIALQTVEGDLTFGNPQPAAFASNINLDFGHTLTI